MDVCYHEWIEGGLKEAKLTQGILDMCIGKKRVSDLL